MMGNISFYIDRRRAKKDGSYPIKLYVSHNKRFYIATPFTSTEENWDVNQYAKSEPNYKTKNMTIRALMNKAEDVMYRLEREDRLKNTTDSTLKKMIEEAISNKAKAEKTLLTCFEEFITTKQKRSTIETYEGTKTKIICFNGDPSFGSIDKKWLIDFDNYMIKAGLSTNTRSIHMRNIRAVFNYAIDEGVTENYPFRKFSIKTEETRKRSLSVDQLIMLRDYPCEGYQIKYRDVFMLMFYLIGINGIDLFSAKELNGDRLEYRRAKTDKLYSIKVEPEALEIINRYKGKEYLIDVLDEYAYYKDFMHRMGLGLKKIGECERKGRGGKKFIKPLFPDLSSYWARHTWATIASILDIPKETISAALGHEIGSSITSIYIRQDQSKVDEANRMVIDYVNDPIGFKRKNTK